MRCGLPCDRTVPMWVRAGCPPLKASLSCRNGWAPRAPTAPPGFPLAPAHGPGAGRCLAASGQPLRRARPAAAAHLLIQVTLHQRQLHSLLDLLLLNVHAADVLRQQCVRGWRGAGQVLGGAGPGCEQWEHVANKGAASGCRRAAGVQGHSGTHAPPHSKGQTAARQDAPHGSSPAAAGGERRAAAPAWYVTSGRSVWDMTEIVESASGGRMSTSALEWRCSATDALGRSSSLRGGRAAGAGSGNGQPAAACHGTLHRRRQQPEKRSAPRQGCCGVVRTWGKRLAKCQLASNPPSQLLACTHRQRSRHALRWPFPAGAHNAAPRGRRPAC